MGWPKSEPVMCTACDTIHEFPVPKYEIGQRVRIVRDGNQHRDKIGQVVEIVGLQTMFRMPCDRVEYHTSAGFGSILEDRLEPCDVS